MEYSKQQILACTLNSLALHQFIKGRQDRIFPPSVDQTSPSSKSVNVNRTVERLQPAEADADQWPHGPLVEWNHGTKARILLNSAKCNLCDRCCRGSVLTLSLAHKIPLYNRNIANQSLAFNTIAKVLMSSITSGVFDTWNDLFDNYHLGKLW